MLAMTSAVEICELIESNDARSDVSELRRRLERDGYLFLRNQLDRDQVLSARRTCMMRLLAGGVLDPTADVMEGIVRQGVVSGFDGAVGQNNPKLKRVLYAGPMMRLFDGLLGTPARHFDYTWVRAVSPGPGTPPHCDHVYMGRGTDNLYTAWTPLGDIDRELGGLMLLEGSNNNQRLRQTYCRLDVDARCANKAGPAAQDAWDKGTNGALAADPLRLQRSLGGRWASAEFRAGDVVVFTTFTVHAGIENRSKNRLRLSSDSRYQPADEPADERWIGADPPAHGPRAKRSLIC